MEIFQIKMENKLMLVQKQLITIWRGGKQGSGSENELIIILMIAWKQFRLKMFCCS